MSRTLLICTLSLAVTNVNAISTVWQPLPSPPLLPSTSVLRKESKLYGSLTPANSPYDIDGQLIDLSHEQEQCSLYKISMSQQLYFEYIHYKIDLPNIKEFTLCVWSKFHNHTNDHPLFSYAVGDQPRGILSWVANTARSSYYMMNVDGHNLYRLNYPLRLNKWYHSCQSWNGRTGEWQIWVNDERVGRGFNNRLVGHVIQGGGIAISGQEQRQLGGGFLEGEGSPPGSGGMLGEITMVQLYGVALTAGKAHKDHKHHHAHHYEHDTTNNTPRPITRQPVTGPPLPPSPFLTGGQINHQVKINPGAPLQIIRNGVIMRHPVLPPPRDPPPQPFPPANLESLSTVIPFVSPSTTLPVVTLQQDPRIFGNPLVRPTGPYHELFKREETTTTTTSTTKKKKEHVRDKIGTKLTTTFKSSVVENKEEEEEEEDNDDKVKFVDRIKDEDTDDKSSRKRGGPEKKKRGILQLPDGLLFDENYAVSQGLENDYFSGLASFDLHSVKHNNNQDDEREPAEAEVKRIMDICDGCIEEPFEKALIMGWRSVPKKVYSGALYIPAVQVCKAF